MILVHRLLGGWRSTRYPHPSQQWPCHLHQDDPRPEQSNENITTAKYENVPNIIAIPATAREKSLPLTHYFKVAGWALCMGGGWVVLMANPDNSGKPRRRERRSAWMSATSKTGRDRAATAQSGLNMDIQDAQDQKRAEKKHCGSLFILSCISCSSLFEFFSSPAILPAR